MRIYLTARWARREEMKSVRNKLTEAGHEVTSRWLDEVDGTDPKHAADIDLVDIDDSQVLLCFSELPEVGYTTGGRHVEIGYAIANSTPVFVVGPRENVFFHLPEISVFATLEEAIAEIES